MTKILREEDETEDIRDFEDVIIDITRAFQKISHGDAYWQTVRKRGNVRYDLQCSFEPTLSRHLDPQINGLNIHFELVRIVHQARLKNKGDAVVPTSQIPLCGYTLFVKRDHKDIIYEAEGILQTNIVKLGDFYMTFEGCNFAKIVMYAAIMTLAEARVYHLIHPAADGTKAIIGALSTEAARRGAPLTLMREKYRIAPIGYGSYGLRKTDDIYWQLMIQVAKGLFHKAFNQPTTKFRVEAPSPSPYLVSSPSAYFLFL